MQNSDVIIIGAGAAGLMCAVTAAERGRSVLVLDGNDKTGRKLRITGKGRCNLTNNCEIREFMNQVPGSPKFLYSSLNRFSPKQTMEWFEVRGLPLKTERGNRVFPVSDNANDVANLLTRQCQAAGVRFVKQRARSIVRKDAAWQVYCGGTVMMAEHLVLCTGGLSYPLTGSDGTGYGFARQFGHTIVPTRPSLVPLECAEDYCAQMQGFSLRNVTLTLYENHKEIYRELGEMLFTHFGVSGPLVLSASAHIRNMGNASYHMAVDLKPGLDEKKLDDRILRDFAKYSNRDFRNALSDLAGSSMIPVLVRISGIPEDTKVNAITRVQRQQLLKCFKEFPLTVTGFRPIDEAIVTSGGVCTDEVNPRTMESKLCPGLFFAGEILDVDAYTGGYNLQIAWSTGHLAGSFA